MASRIAHGPSTLAIDIGGSGIKASVLDAKGVMRVERVRVETPRPPTPRAVISSIIALVAPLPRAGRASVGFPGVVRSGRIVTAPNLGTREWRGIDLERTLATRLKVPTRVLNDADMQGYGAIAGRGVEMVVTLGTGFGTALFQDGRLAPHLELAHHPFRRRQTYEQQLGDRERRAIGDARWGRRMSAAIDVLRALVNFDHLYIGGGNARRLAIKLASDVSLVDNAAGITGGIALWRHDAR